MNVQIIDLLNQIESLATVCALADEQAAEKGISWYVFNIFAEHHFRKIEQMIRGEI